MAVMLEGSVLSVVEDGKHLKFGGVEFVGRSPPHDQYEFGRGRSFESQRG
jgi:hypothetical protein